MKAAFAIAGYDAEHVKVNSAPCFGRSSWCAPHGAAPGIDRMVMLLAKEENIREITAFPLNQRAQ